MRPEEFYPPKRHAPVNSSRLDQRILEIWSIYSDIAHHLGDINSVTETEELPEDEWGIFKNAQVVGSPLLNLWVALCARDVTYMVHGRPIEVSNNRRYRSAAKAHILDGIKAGSPEIDITCIGVRASVKYSLDHSQVQLFDDLAEAVRGSYSQLAASWEQRHEAYGQFTPADLAPLVGGPLLDATIEGDDWRLALVA